MGKILTKNKVHKLGLDRKETITEEDLQGYTQIGPGAFDYCSSLQSVIIPEGITHIGKWAFFNCNNLTSVTLPKSILSIECQAFGNCFSLQTVNYTGDITSWCDIQFKHANSNPLYYARDLIINGELITDLVIPNTVTTIKDWAFVHYCALKSVVISDSVTEIGNAAFSDCSFLACVTIGNNVTCIGKSAFDKCMQLTSINIPDSVISIGDAAFYYCVYLTTLTIGKGLTRIGRSAFRFCTRLSTVTFPNREIEIEAHAFAHCDKLTSISFPNSVKSIGSEAFAGCISLTSVTIKDQEYQEQPFNTTLTKAYKAFSKDLICRGFKYKEGRAYREQKIKLCSRGFHACLKLSDVFNYYNGTFNREIVVHEVFLEDISPERQPFDSKVVAHKITIGKKIL